MAEASYRPGDSGAAVEQIHALLAGLGLLTPDAAEPAEGADGADGSSYDDRLEVAVRAFQQDRGLTVDGVVGPETFRRLHEARWRLGDRILTHLPGNLMAGDDVFGLQRRLLDLGFRVGRVDGYFGTETETAVRDFQRNSGVPADGTCGPATLQALGRLAPMVRGGAPNTLRGQELIREAGPHLGGKIVVIDAGRAHNLPPELQPVSDEIIHDLAQRIVGRLVAIGVQAFLTSPRGALDVPPESERAAFANRAGGDVLVSLAADFAGTSEASGVSTYFFGDPTQEAWSSVGERLAGLVQREIVARSDLVDLRSHPKTWDMLRRTRMPAVRLDVGYLTNPADTERLRTAGFRDLLAEAIVVAVQRFYLAPEEDTSTGLMRMSDLRAGVRALEGD